MSNPFLEAVKKGDVAAVRDALARDPALACAPADVVDAPGNVRGWTPLHAATRHGHVEVARLLLDAGADIEARAGNERESRTALHDSFEFGQGAITELLLERGAYYDVCVAAGCGDMRRLRELVEADPGRVVDESSGLAPIGWAAYGDQPEAVAFLLARGAAIEDSLCCAAECAHVDVGRALLDQGAQVNRRLASGATALHLAAALPHTFRAERFVAMLLEAGADPALRTNDGKTALDVAREKLASEDVPARRVGFEKVIAVLEGVSP